ncbi:MAG: glycosyltransferase, partial [Bacteroidales bacterium]|nr:glycosyltransferase [Bacteroidales bacterium]
YLPIGVEDVMDKSLDQAPAGSKIVFSLGRLVGYKGYTYLVDAAKYLPRDYVIVIGGGGPLRDELQAQIDSLPEGSASVKLLGRVPDEELRKWYNSCKVFVLSSIWKTEAFAIVQVEAMSCAKPIVATKIPASGVSWVNEDGVSGVNVPVCDSQALARAIVHICEDEKRYQRFCEDARSRYETLFTYGVMISGCKKIYESL